MRDEDIDLSDIPETTERLSGARAAHWRFRPVKQPITIRLDADVVGWFRSTRKAALTNPKSTVRFDSTCSTLKRNPPDARRRPRTARLRL